ncbi:MAG TPA: prepilin-type N-terminal cleavage/methylation domain-containing protein [Thermoanaerobaculia bacterium]|jgi:type II secretion system protein G|nr:prepilin-type N-terminal cleavage/methylation domain-containing protein [Thermoanaerobaculia bacterium]
MHCHLNIRRKGQRGFTLIEMLIVVAVIGIIVSMLIPNLLDAFQKAKQKRTMGDMKIIGTAMFSWITDQSAAAAAGATASQVDLTQYGTQLSVADMTTVLVSQYIQSIPTLDGWKSPYQYYLRTDNPHAAQVMAIRSLGRDRTAEGDVYTITAFDPTDYDKDIIWADGFMARYPQKR